MLATFYVDNSPSLGTPASGDEVFTPVGGTQTTQGGLTLGTNLFLTIGEAVTAAAANAETDIINVADGTYPESVGISETMTVRGNQFGVDAQSGRVGAAETIVGNGSTPFQLNADDIVLDGFTLQGATNASLSFGVTLVAGSAGSEVRNNIIQNNVAGISLANDSASNQTIISGNLIRNNNNPGPVSGTGIYSDQSTAGGALTNVLIINNTITGHNNPGVIIGSTDAASPASNITLSSNIVTGNANGFLLFNILNSTVTRNEFRGSLGSQLVLEGGVNGLAVTENFIEEGLGRGIRIERFFFDAANQNITINRNSIENNAGAGLEIDNGGGTAYVGILNAEFNWWGSASGPLHAQRNPTGTGEEIVDPANQVDFDPWLTNGNDTQAGIRGFQPGIADLSIVKTDDPDTVEAGSTLTYTIVVANNGPAGTETNAIVTDIFPAELTDVTFTSVATGGATGNDASGSGNINDTVTLPAGSSVTYTVTGTVHPATAEGTISNTATVTAPPGTFETNPGSESDTETTDVVRPSLPECDVETLNSPGDDGSATIEDDADFPGSGVLIVTGTSGNDVIIVEPNPKDRSEIRVRRNGRTIAEFESSDFDRIVVFGLEGNDKIIINASLSHDAVLFGDEGNDQLFGARGDDSLDGGEGNDKLFGGDGDDALCGDDGNDLLFGQRGNDTLHGEEGNDKLYGESGDDLLIGGDGNDYLFGSSGNDRAFGEQGNDHVFGDSGDDIVVGGDGNDKVYGGSGEDLMIGGEGSDSMYGGSGDDILVAGSTSHDNDELALMAILNEWTSSRSYSDRVDNISGEGAGGDNGPFFLNDATVFDDDDNDTLYGQGGVDWFLVGEGDRVKDRARSGERVTDFS